jgi:hypothetical protein
MVDRLAGGTIGLVPLELSTPINRTGDGQFADIESPRLTT